MNTLLTKTCEGCDRQYVRINDEVYGCPKFPRSWRNLFIGGLTHDAIQVADHNEDDRIEIRMVYR